MIYFNYSSYTSGNVTMNISCAIRPKYYHSKHYLHMKLARLIKYKMPFNEDKT